MAPVFGLEVTTATIRAPGAAARGVKSVLLTHDRSRVEGSEQVALDAEGIGIARLRSSGVGSARVRVTAPHFQHGEQLVQFTWPLSFLGAALLGGMTGGYPRHYPLPAARSRRHGWFWLFRSVLLGLLVAVAYAVGVNLLGIDVGAGIGEAFVFTIAALGAIVGIRLPGARRSVAGRSHPQSCWCRSSTA